jgi:hypothetical protein
MQFVHTYHFLLSGAAFAAAGERVVCLTSKLILSELANSPAADFFAFTATFSRPSSFFLQKSTNVWGLSPGEIRTSGSEILPSENEISPASSKISHASNEISHASSKKSHAINEISHAPSKKSHAINGKSHASNKKSHAINGKSHAGMFCMLLNDKFISMFYIKNYVLWEENITCPPKTRTCLPG